MKKIIIISTFFFFMFSLTSQAQSSCCIPKKSNTIANTDVNLQITKTVKFKITGITCAGCSNAIYKALKDVNGVINHSVKYPGDIAIIKFDNTKINIEALKKVIEKKGYKVKIVKENIKEKS